MISEYAPTDGLCGPCPVRCRMTLPVALWSGYNHTITLHHLPSLVLKPCSYSLSDIQNQHRVQAWINDSTFDKSAGRFPASSASPAASLMLSVTVVIRSVRAEDPFLLLD